MHTHIDMHHGKGRVTQALNHPAGKPGRLATRPFASPPTMFGPVGSARGAEMVWRACWGRRLGGVSGAPFQAPSSTATVVGAGANKCTTAVGLAWLPLGRAASGAAPPAGACLCVHGGAWPHLPGAEGPTPACRVGRLGAPPLPDTRPGQLLALSQFVGVLSCSSRDWLVH
jgi:hypothetical protein